MDEKRRAVRYGMVFLFLGLFLLVLFVWNVNSGSIHLSVSRNLEDHFQEAGRRDGLQHCMGYPASKNSCSRDSWRSPFGVRLSASDVF